MVLLDVDNGPGYLVHDANAALYDADLLAATRAALADGRPAASSGRRTATPRCTTALREVFGNAEERAYDVDLQGRDERTGCTWPSGTTQGRG